MHDYTVDISEFLTRSHTMPVIDVRSPAEFDHGHIPGALNMPLFSNEERSVVGTLYLQKGSSEAMIKGLELIGPKLKEFAARALDIAQDRELLLHCWRGGMRSNSMAWLLNTIGISSLTLEGGYKNYRRYVHDFFTKPFNLMVIGGMTGSGKTEVLEILESLGKQVIHLERLANHRGSVFGDLGHSWQPTTEQFENDLFSQLAQMNASEPIFIEDESLAVGRIFIPKSFHEQMAVAPAVNLIVSRQRRIQQLVSAYAGGDKEMLVACVKRLDKRLGSESATLAIEHIREGKLADAVDLLLRYYDKVYTRSMGLRNRLNKLEILVTEETPAEIAAKIINII